MLAAIVRTVAPSVPCPEAVNMSASAFSAWGAVMLVASTSSNVSALAATCVRRTGT